MKRFFLFIGDISILYLSLFMTIYIRYGRSFNTQLGFHIFPFTIIFAVWTIVFYITNLYEISFTKNEINFFSDFFYSITAVFAISIFLFYFIPFFYITPKTNFFIFTAIATILQALWRFYFNRLTAKSGYKNNTLIIGLNQQSQELYDFLLANPQLGYGALGIIDVEDHATYSILENLIKQKNIKTLVLGPSVYNMPHIIDVLYRLVGFRLNFHNLSDFYEQITGRVPLGVIDQAWFLENLSEGRKRVYELGKRALDIIGAIIIGIVSLPLYPFIISAVRFDSKGPVFYQQARVGRAGKILTLIKFRTMFHDAEKTG
ncbi:MAG: sugar transferase, partial [Candidatus Buchananbacteria bacterium]|nr:sugar transferase [Candidatus Buchananbacteria bacterium]